MNDFQYHQAARRAITVAAERTPQQRLMDAILAEFRSMTDGERFAASDVFLAMIEAGVKANMEAQK